MTKDGNKECKHCGARKPTSEFNKAGKYLQPYCKSCDSARKKKWKMENAQRIKKTQQEYYRKNRGSIRARRHDSYLRNRDSIIAYQKKYRQENKDKISERNRAYTENNAERLSQTRREQRIKNHEAELEKERIARSQRSPEQRAKYLAYLKKYREANKDKYNQYRQDNKAKLREMKRHYCNKRSSSEVEYRLLKNMRSRIRFALKSKGTIKADTTVQLLGCSIPEFKEYFQSLFTDEMTWDDFMSGKIHVDHITPCVMFDLTKDDQQKECFHYTNLQPLWAKDNLRKGATIPPECISQ